MKRTKHSDLLDEDEHDAFNRDLSLKRAKLRSRLNASCSSSSRGSSGVSHNHTNRVDRQSEGGPANGEVKDDPEPETQSKRRRAQSDPPMSTANVNSRAVSVSQTISGLSKKAAELSKKQQEHMLAAERLQQRLTRGEQSLGEQLRESLKIQRAIQERREQNRIDKQQLEIERHESKLVANDLDKVLCEMQTVAEQI